MTVLTGKLQSIGGKPWGGPGHFVVIFSRLARPGTNGTVILKLRDRIPMPTTSNGEFTSTDMDPGPIRVELEGGELHGQAWDLVLPETTEGDPPAELADLIDTQFEWTPGFVSRTEAAARRAEEARDEAVEARKTSVLSAEQTGNDAYMAARAAASAQGDAEQTAQDRQHVDQVKGHVDDTSAAAILAAQIIHNIWDDGDPGEPGTGDSNGPWLIEHPVNSLLYPLADGNRLVAYDPAETVTGLPQDVEDRIRALVLSIIDGTLT